MKNFKAVSTVARAATGGALVAVMLVAPASASATGSQKLLVTANIAKHASLKVLAQPSAVVVTAADVAKGYVDVPAAAEIAVTSNSLSGYMLEFASRGSFIRQIMVKGLARDVQLSAEGGTVMQLASGSGVTKKTLALGFRFLLAESTEQGIYPWPMHLSVTPL